MAHEQTIRDKLNSTPSQEEAAHLSVELAIYLTRGGHFDEAQSIYNTYHQSTVFGEDFNLSLRLMLLESMLLFYQRRDVTAAIDRANRALRLGLMRQGENLTGNLSAWLAHFQFNSCRYLEMAENMSVAIENESLLSGDTAARLALTVADAMALSGRLSEADSWYRTARKIASSLGDQLYIGAVVHNRSTLRLARIRYEIACLEREISDFGGAILEFSSAVSYEQYIDSRDSVYPYDLWRARVELLKNEFEPARRLLYACLERRDIDERSSLQAQILADLAYCEFGVGNMDAAIDSSSRALQCDLASVYLDDLAVIYSRCSSVAQKSGDISLHLRCTQLMTEAVEAFDIEQRRVASALDSIVPKVSRFVGVNVDN